MSELESHLQDEIDRLKEWREGKHFRLHAFVSERDECRRCHLTKPSVFVVLVREPITWSPEVLPPLAPAHERVCRDCLTDSEIAALLLPAFSFVVTILLRDWQDPKIGDNDLLRSLHYVRSYLACRPGIAMHREQDLKDLSLRALEGLKNIPPPKIDIDRLYTDLQNAIARNMFLAANPDDVPESVEDARKLESKVGIFFRDSASIETYCLRDSVRKCVEIFRRYFMRKP